MMSSTLVNEMIVGENALNQEQGVAAPPAAHTVSPPATPLPSAPPNGSASAPIGSRSTLARLAIPLFAVLVALAFIAFATLRWDAWVGHATSQTTNDAYVRAELTRLSSRVAGEVLIVAANDFQRVKAGDLLVQIDPADYEAQVAQAEAGVAGAQAALENNLPERIGVGSSKQVLGEDFKPAITRARDHPMPDRDELAVKAARKLHRGRAKVFDSIGAVHVASAAVETRDGAEHPRQ